MGLGTMEQRTEGMKKQAQELIDHAYDRGYKAGYEKGFKNGFDEGALHPDINIIEKWIEQGRNEAWEAAKKIAADCFSESKMTKELFNFNYAYAVFENFSASEAIENIKEYEKEKQEEEQEIRVGDEVYFLDNTMKYVVTNIDGEFLKLVDCTGDVDVDLIQNFTRTGLHFDEIENVLKKLKERKGN